jgi:NAD(P)-dependent dehydrogenase (short-subunit alcohol dehydrogenase family)
MILVTAATAPVGRSIVEQLVAAGRPVRALTRDPAKAGLPSAAEVVPGDMSDPASLSAAFKDVSAVFLLAAVPGFAPADVPFAMWEKHVGTPAPVTDTVERLTGHPPRSAAQGPPITPPIADRMEYLYNRRALFAGSRKRSTHGFA